MSGIETQFQPIASQYSQLENDQEKSSYELVVNWPSIMRQLPAPPARVLDYGCASGTYAALLAAAGYDVLAVDNAPDMLQPHEGVRTRLWSYQDQPLAEQFEAIVAKLVVQFVEDLPAFATAMRRQLVPGGVIVISVPNPDRSRPLVGGATTGSYLTHIGASGLEVRMIHREQAEFEAVFTAAGFHLAAAVKPQNPAEPAEQPKRLNLVFAAL